MQTDDILDLMDHDRMIVHRNETFVPVDDWAARFFPEPAPGTQIGRAHV